MRAAKGSFSLRNAAFTGTAVGLLAALFAFFNLLGSLERNALDLRFSLRGEVEPAGEILIVGITETCLDKLGRWPWDRDLHARLLSVLTDGSPVAVGMDLIVAEPSQDWLDEALIEATRGGVPVIFPIDAPPAPGEKPGFLTPRYLTLPLPGLLEHARAGFINVTPDVDGVLRRAILLMEHEGTPLVSFSVLTWAVSQEIHVDDLYRDLVLILESGRSELPLGEFSFPLDNRGRTLINFSGGPNTFPVLPYHLVLSEAYSSSTFQDKIILVGYFAPGLGDYFITPYARDTPMYGVELHANTIHTLLQSGPIFELPLWLNVLTVFLMGFMSIFIFRILHPAWGLLGLAVLAAGFFMVTMQFFESRSIYVESVYSMMALGGSYVGALGYRFIAEQKNRQRVTRLFGRYVAPQVVEEILNLGEENLKLGGTRRRITLLFIDIRGFTPLSERLSPEDVVYVLNRFFDIVTRCVFQNKGTLDKYMGDAAMAMFNAPLLLEDHVIRALRAAEAIIHEGASLQRQVMDMFGVELSFGIGVNTGDAVVGNIGSENRMEYTAIGDTVNLAARLESSSKPGQVLVSEAVFRDAAGRMPLEYVGEIFVKGKNKPVKVYQLVGYDVDR